MVDLAEPGLDLPRPAANPKLSVNARERRPAALGGGLAVAVEF